MRTRCPECSTVFRVTSEQLRLKAGKVRCGQCQAVFNAFDGLLPDAPPSELAEDVPEAAPAVAEMPAAPDPLPQPSEPAAIERAPLAATVGEENEPSGDDFAPLFAELPDEPPPDVSFFLVDETLEESTSAARQAGLVAARDLSETPAYNRWAAGTLAGNGLGGFDNDTAKRPVWPFVLVAVFLYVVLIVQLLHYFRTEIVQRLPDAAPLYGAVGIDVPLPRNADLVAIETSDLQSDNARGLFVLQATLHNRAKYVQAWPALELTLTDTNDTVVSRRVMRAEEYLPPNISPEAFPANGEVAVRLWIEARNIGAAGYRLYIFYP